jgi:acyl-CoA reductase-like NAD-dependent aldehyde dehydrogenase
VAATLSVVEPATEQVLAEIERATAADVDAAVARAKAAWPAWRAVAPGDRATLLRRLADVIAEHHEELSVLEARNAGKPIGDARGEMGMVVDTFRYYAGAPERLLGDTIPVAGGLGFTVREPLGVVGLITPWNFPLTIASWKLAPALAAGNTVVLKPAELTPLTALRFAELALEAGVPEGVVEVVAGPGSQCGARLVEHPDVAKIAFTGSTDVGRSIAAGAAATIKRVTLELGGKSANVVFADADLERAAASAPSAVFDNAGQDCCARSRILVQRSAYDRFLELLEPAVQRFRVEDPALDSAEMGPLISRGQWERVASYVPDDAPVAFRGTAPAGPGFWFPPTVLAPTDPRDRTLTDEIFGPVVAVVPFEDEADAVRIANEGEYGLSGSIWTRDVGTALRVSRGIEAGNLSVNSNSSVRYSTPFGGFKQSGLGRELGPDALNAFTDEKNVFLSTEG